MIKANAVELYDEKGHFKADVHKKFTHIANATKTRLLFKQGDVNVLLTHLQCMDACGDVSIEIHGRREGIELARRLTLVCLDEIVSVA